jgi:hypothetical protein
LFLFTKQASQTRGQWYSDTSLRFVHTRDLNLAISLSDAISIEIFPSFQIATAGDGDNI